MSEYFKARLNSKQEPAQISQQTTCNIFNIEDIDKTIKDSDTHKGLGADIFDGHHLLDKKEHSFL